ncbi:hypothetical protein NQ318_019407 [Aromia moschata]|uniref:Uncharacterized protein n=1 Tax=Aromia moschata TaxID=1265417 RepID=A0AAV8XDW0_9CUCU|nr:hypothetical protein NQ318_019407 [Aromia moschata]
MYRKNILGGITTEKGQFERFMRDIRRVYPGVGKVPMKLKYEDILNCACHECEPNQGTLLFTAPLEADIFEPVALYSEKPEFGLLSSSLLELNQ